MKTTHIILFVIVIAAWPPYVSGQGDPGTRGLINRDANWNLTGAGAKAMSMGGAFLAFVDDATAISWNPARLASLQAPGIATVARSLITSYGLSGAGSSTRTDFSLSTRHFELPLLAVAIPLKLSSQPVVLAGGYQRQIDFALDLIDGISSLKTNVSGWALRDTLSYTTFSTTMIEKGADTYSIGIGSAINKLLSIGAAINIWRGQPGRTDKQSNDRYAVYVNDYALDAIEDIRRDHLSFKSRTQLEFDIAGINYMIGVTLDFVNSRRQIPLRIGATLRTPFKMGITFDKNESSLHWSIINYYLDEELVSSQKTYYDSEEVESGSYEIEMPIMLGFGLFYQPRRNWTFALDYEWRDYPGKRYGSRYIYDTDGEGEPFGLRHRQIRAGTEYIITTRSDIHIPVRLGFQTVPSLRPFSKTNETLAYIIGNVETGLCYTLGTGIDLNWFEVDLAVSHYPDVPSRPKLRKTIYALSCNIHL